MKTRICLLAIALLLITGKAFTAVRYVNAASQSSAPPYTTWATSAATIQDAVDAAEAGDEIAVTNGVYDTGGRAVNGALTNRVAVTKPLTVRGVNGPAVTLIVGYHVPETTNGDSAVRCVYSAGGATLVGFTLTNGGTAWPFVGPEDGWGGGVFCQSLQALVSNCVLIGNSASYHGGGAAGGVLNNCAFIGNSAVRGGGASEHPCCWESSVPSILNNCTLRENSAAEYGGAANQSELNNCILSGNSAVIGGGASESHLNSCALVGNRALELGGGALWCFLNNCTITGNTSDAGLGGVYACRLYNCIAYYNSGANYDEFHLGTTLNYSCTTPLPPDGFGNITNEPAFVNLGAGDFRLQSDSPCINAGWNGEADGGADLAGLPRIAGGTVDIGAYEFQSPASTIFYAWLLQYGLPLDGSTDTTDSDGDRLTNWQEWRCGTDPTNALSVLRLLTPMSVGSDLLVRWESVEGRKYFLEWSTNLASPATFLPLATGIIGQAGLTTYRDTNAASNGPYFYRADVE